MRIFISIDIPEKIKNQIKSIQSQLPEFYGKKTEPENLHLTLKFLGEVDKDKINNVEEKLKEIKLMQFKTEIKDIGVFSDRIIWLHMTDCDKLQKEIDNALEDLLEKERRFMSHLTIARVKKIKDKKKFLKGLKGAKIPKIKFIVDSFKLKKSVLTEKGPVYETLEEYKLG